MAVNVGAPLQTIRAWWLQSLYALLLLSALALVTLLVGETYYAIEEARESTAPEHAPIFVLAWFVFVPTLVATLVAAPATLVAGWALHRSSLTRYGIRASAFCAFAIAIVAAVAAAQL